MPASALSAISEKQVFKNCPSTAKLSYVGKTTVDGVEMAYVYIDGEGVQIGNGTSCAIDATKTGSVTIPSMIEIGGGSYPVKKIAAHAFHQCKMSSVTIPSSVTAVDWEAFASSSITSVTVPSSVRTLGAGAFENCKSLSEINIPASVTTIGTNAFSVCHNLKSIKLPDSVTDVEFGVFQSCQVLESVTLPEHVKSIGESAFERCESLKEINLPASLVKIGRDAFAFCDNLQRMIVEKDSYAEKYCAGNNLPYIYANTPVLSGNKCGDNLEWELENGTLAMSGTGKMDD